MKIGLIGAVPEEVQLFESFLRQKETRVVGDSTLTIGKFGDHTVVVGFTRCGKVSAANLTSILIHVLKVDFILFVGIAGVVDPSLSVGDIVIASELIQYDINSDESTPYKKFEIPLLGIDRIKADSQYVALAEKVITHLLEKELGADEEFQKSLKGAGLCAPRVVPGLVGTADQFATEKEKIKLLKEELPDLKCVEMEGAAIAQICYCHKIPFLVIRVISDNADENAQTDFCAFISNVGARLLSDIAKSILGGL